MLEFGNFNLQFFFPSSGRLVFEPLAAAILKAGVAILFELLYPMVDLLLADVVLESCFTVVSAIGNAVFGNLNPFLHGCRTCFFHAAPS